MLLLIILILLLLLALGGGIGATAGMDTQVGRRFCSS